MDFGQSLEGLSAYPIPSATLQDIAEETGIDLRMEMTTELRGSRGFKRAKALAYRFLSHAPNVSQGGISYSFSEKEREWFQSMADKMFEEAGDEDSSMRNECGYIGEDL